MAIQEQQGMTGRLTIVLRNHHGQVVAHHQVNNLITTAGKTLVARLFTGEVQGKPDFLIAVGDSGNSVASTDTRLQHELDRIAATTSAVQLVEEGGQKKVVVKLTATLPVLSGDQQQELREAGTLIKLPNQEPVLYNRVIFPVVTRASNLEMTLTWEVLF
ncbi:MAG: hypothetical protein U1F76_20060 [Candidatus Competibacteraceae bacterium]